MDDKPSLSMLVDSAFHDSTQLQQMVKAKDWQRAREHSRRLLSSASRINASLVAIQQALFELEERQ